VSGVNQLIEMIAAQARHGLGEEVFNAWYGEGFNVKYDDAVEFTTKVIEALASVPEERVA
ncbi:MAG TPA: hypothetical protein VEY71_00780, partial [Chitinophagales bacterium]|nr:hypothetical protein [Chitinophagales bacterium]